MYVALVLDLATIGYFLDDHEMRLVPKKMVAPKVILLSLRSHAQSTSQKTCKDGETLGE